MKKGLKDELVPDKNELKKLDEITSKIISGINSALKKTKVKAKPFVGGSFAKGTLVRGEKYDIDLFIRYKDKEIAKATEKWTNLFSKDSKIGLEKIHGSRDYYRAIIEGITFEMIPVKEIRRPSEAENVTDLSYAHVNYVKRKLKGRESLRKDILFAKAFCRAHNVYGAESYVQGFSGYALECLLIHYGSFDKMAKEIVRAKDKIIIDPEKHYKNRNEILLSLNESKLKSPIVLIDPTWKERNVLAAVSEETYAKFKESLESYLKNPRKELLKDKEINQETMMKRAKGNELAVVRIETGRQKGDIAGTKLRKFSEFLLESLSRDFIIKEKEFVYDGYQSADAYYITESRGKQLKRGPPVEMEAHAKAFRKMHKKTFVKDGLLYTEEENKDNVKSFIRKFLEKNKRIVQEMGITKALVIN